MYQETNVREMRTYDDPECFGTLRAEPIFSVSSPLFLDTEFREFDYSTFLGGWSQQLNGTAFLMGG